VKEQNNQEDMEQMQTAEPILEEFLMLSPK
jgi:hypothetical protein